MKSNEEIITENKTEVKLLRPFAGWSRLEFVDDRGCEFSGCLSYIDDVPWMLLKAFKVFIDTNCQTAITFDEEGTNWTLVLDHCFTRIIYEREVVGGLCLFITFEELAKGVCNDLKNEIDEWVKFNYYTDEDLDNFEKDKNEILKDISYVLESIGEEECPILE